MLIRALFISITLSTSFSFGQSWKFMFIEKLTSPSLDLNSQGYPGIAYMDESLSGNAGIAQYNPATQQFDKDTIAVGYFYGPLELKYNHADLPGVVYHDHRGNDGDQAHVYFDGSDWTVEYAPSVGHDGWDNSLIYTKNDEPRTVAVDANNAIEYGWKDNSGWHVETLADVGTPYGYSTGIDLDSTDKPHVTYYVQNPGELIYGHKTNATWTLEKVDSIGNTGAFNYLVLDQNDRPHISYCEIRQDTLIVKYAQKTGQDWIIQNIDTLTNSTTGFTGARDATGLVQDSSGQWHLIYTDKSVIKIAHRIEDEWTIETVLDISNTGDVLGQLVTMKYDIDLNAHIAYRRIGPQGGLGEIYYGTTSNLISGIKTIEKSQVDIFPNPSQNIVSFSKTEKYHVISILGNEVMSGESDHVTVSNLAPGVYTILIDNSTGTTTSSQFIKY